MRETDGDGVYGSREWREVEMRGDGEKRDGKKGDEKKGVESRKKGVGRRDRKGWNGEYE